MDIHCNLCGRVKNGIEWDGTIPLDPGEVHDQIHELEQTQSKIRSDDTLLLSLIENQSEFCPMCMQLMDGIRDETDEEELDTRITLQVAYLEDQLDRWASRQV